MDAIREPEQEVHVVLDDHDRVAPLELGDEVGEPRRAVGAEARRRLVEEQDPRLRRQRERDLERAALAVREVARARPLAPAQADAREQRRRLVLRRRVAREVAPGVERARARARAAR